MWEGMGGRVEMMRGGRSFKKPIRNCNPQSTLPSFLHLNPDRPKSTNPSSLSTPESTRVRPPLRTPSTVSSLSSPAPTSEPTSFASSSSSSSSPCPTLTVSSKATTAWTPPAPTSTESTTSPPLPSSTLPLTQPLNLRHPPTHRILQRRLSPPVLLRSSWSHLPQEQFYLWKCIG